MQPTDDLITRIDVSASCRFSCPCDHVVTLTYTDGSQEKLGLDSCQIVRRFGRARDLISDPKVADHLWESAAYANRLSAKRASVFT